MRPPSNEESGEIFIRGQSHKGNGTAAQIGGWAKDNRNIGRQI
jgi:hypothetical protein